MGAAWERGGGGRGNGGLCVCCANINHVDSHKIIRADHSQSGSLPNISLMERRRRVTAAIHMNSPKQETHFVK